MLPLLASMAILTALLLWSIVTSSLSAPAVFYAVACAAFQSQVVFGVSSGCCHLRTKENPPPSAKAALLREAQAVSGWRHDAFYL